jgi:TRAP-type C4-dicarboxylate transport system permease small subunit
MCCLKQTENEHRQLGVLQLVDQYLDLFEITVTAVVLCSMTIVILINIILRYVMKIPNSWGEEISRYLFVTFVFIGVSMCVRGRKNVGVTIFVDKIPVPLRRIVMIAVDLITIVTLSYISRLSWYYVYTSLARPQYSVGTGLPMFIIYGVMALGLTMSALRSVMLFSSDYLTQTHPLGGVVGVVKEEGAP